MKQIIAFIKPHMLSNMTTALKNLPGLTGMSISEVGGFSRVTNVETAVRISTGDRGEGAI